MLILALPYSGSIKITHSTRWKKRVDNLVLTSFFFPTERNSTWSTDRTEAPLSYPRVWVASTHHHHHHNMGVSRIVAPERDVSCVAWAAESMVWLFSTARKQAQEELVAWILRNQKLRPILSTWSASNAANKSIQYFQRSKKLARGHLFVPDEKRSGALQVAASVEPNHACLLQREVAKAPLETCTRRFTWLFLFSIPRAILHGPKHTATSNICVCVCCFVSNEHCRKKRLALTMCSAGSFIPARNGNQVLKVHWTCLAGAAAGRPVWPFSQLCLSSIYYIFNISIFSLRTVVIKLLDHPIHQWDS